MVLSDLVVDFLHVNDIQSLIHAYFIFQPLWKAFLFEDSFISKLKVLVYFAFLNTRDLFKFKFKSFFVCITSFE